MEKKSNNYSIYLILTKYIFYLYNLILLSKQYEYIIWEIGGETLYFQITPLQNQVSPRDLIM
jgi:hypothetical protein